jgi:hypothetical protein
MPDLLVSQDTHPVAFTDAAATQRWHGLTLPNDAGGALHMAHEQATRHGCETVHIDCEAPGVYAWHLGLWPSQPTDPPRRCTDYELQHPTVPRYTATLASKWAKTDHTDTLGFRSAAR